MIYGIYLEFFVSLIVFTAHLFFHKPLSSFFFDLEPLILTKKNTVNGGNTGTTNPATNATIQPTATNTNMNFNASLKLVNMYN